MFFPSVTGVGRANSFVPGGGPALLRKSRSAFHSTLPSPRPRQTSVPGSATTITRSLVSTGLECPAPTEACHLMFFFSLHSVGGDASGNSPVPFRRHPKTAEGKTSASAAGAGAGAVAVAVALDAGVGAFVDVAPTPDLPLWRAWRWPSPRR